MSMTGGGNTAAYKYDAFNRRVAKTVGGVTTYYVYDEDEIIEERTQAETLLAHYVYGPEIDEALHMKRGATNYYYAQDGLGSVANLLNVAGAAVENYEYDVYGKPAAPSSVGNPVMFTGRWFDKESGNYDYRARIYQPTIGRFMQRDPIGYWDSMNLYQYVGNNPINYVDPFGLKLKYKGNFLQKIITWWNVKKLKNNSGTAKIVIEDIVENKDTVYIEQTKGGNSYEPSSKICKFNPNSKQIGSGNNPWDKRPPEVGLGHELIHAHHDIHGNLGSTRQIEEDKTTGIGPYSKDPLTDNRIRDDYGIPRRPYY